MFMFGKEEFRKKYVGAPTGEAGWKIELARGGLARVDSTAGGGLCVKRWARPIVVGVVVGKVGGGRNLLKAEWSRVSK